jgi:hypothetical protein
MLGRISVQTLPPLLAISLSFLVLLPLAAVQSQAQSDDSGAQLHAAMPLGGDSMLLQPSNQRLNMLATVEAKDFDNIKLTGNGRSRKVTDLSGNPVSSFPRELTFRFTIGSRTIKQETSAYTVNTPVSLDKFQSNLHFRLKVFRGIEVQNFDPAEAKIVGIPPQVPCDERIYRVTFSLPEIPVSDRMMLEVLDEAGARVAKFHLQLM